MSNAVLSLRNIEKIYHQGDRELHVLHGVDLDIRPGELVALVGPSGSGKSTLLQIAGLLDLPDNGAIAIAGITADHASDSTRTRLRNQEVGFIYQFHHLLPELTALENVMMPQRLAGVATAPAKARASLLLERLGLAQRLNHLPSQLSGGEQQRVAIARALANRPSLLLADEPTGNLDPATSERVCELFLSVAKEENAAALIATHNMALARRLHRAVTLVDGKLIEAKL